MSNDDLTDGVEAMFRDVPAVEDSVRDAHVAAALDEIRSGPGAVVLPFERRGALRFVAAAAVAVVLGVGVGWTVRGDGREPLATDSTEAVRNADVGSSPKTTVKGGTGSASCDFSGLQDSGWLGEYEMDGRRYGLFVNNWSVVWYDLDTCDKVQDIPHPTTTAP